MSKYDEMQAFYEKHIEELKHEVEFWRDRSLNNSCKALECAGQVELYEKIFDKILGERVSGTDEIFMFETRAYRPRSFTLNRNPGEPDTLDVEFVATGIPQLNKGENKC